MRGFERGRNLDKLGMHAQDTAELFFSDVEVPAANLLGEEGKGFRHLMSTLAASRASLAATTTHDIYVPLSGHGVNDPKTFRMGRWFALAWGIILTGGALLFPEGRTPVVVIALSIASFTQGALLGGFAALSGLITLDAVDHAIRAKFGGRVAEGNVAAAAEVLHVITKYDFHGSPPSPSSKAAGP